MLFFSATVHAQAKITRICAAKNGTNTITWNFNTPAGCDLKSVQVWGRENTFNVFKNIEQVDIDETVKEYQHKNATGFVQGSYYLIFIYKCTDGVTYGLSSDTVAVDVQVPPVMDPDSISVNADGEIFIGWSPSGANDAKSYVVYRTDNTGNKIIGEVSGRFNTMYKDVVNGDAGKQAEKYKIAAKDSCDNIAPIGNFHQSIFLSISQDRCASEVYINWSPYIGWADGIERYDIYYSAEKYLNFKKLGDTKDLTFTAKFLPNHTDLYFYVRAVKSGNSKITSSSNHVSIKTLFEDSTQFLYLSNVTYIKNSNVLSVEWYVESGHNYDYFDVKRGKAPAVLWNVGRVKASNLTEYAFTESDPDSNFIWYYQITGYSNCGSTLGKSNNSNNIKLQVQEKADHNKLSWNKYSSYAANVQAYEVYRTFINKGIFNELLLETLPAEQDSFLDFTEFNSDASPGVCYYIKAIEDNGNPYGFKKESFSNVVCYTVPPIVYVPNAFVPDGIYNKAFLPSTLYADSLNSTLTIYNRWGEKILENQPVWKGWDGKLPDGKYAPQGVYLYTIEILGIDRSVKVYSSTFTLLL